MSDIHKNIVAGRRKGCRNYPLEFKQRLVVASYEPGVSVSKLALENGINANLLFKWRQHSRLGKIPLPISPEADMPLLLPITLDAETKPANQPPFPPAERTALPLSCEITFRNGTLRLDGSVSENMLAMLIQELKR
ncbi:transposase [Serratia ureilytica]|uniref:IS66-like element accessory protein TnpA n=1 Tax=Serratia ureilytica TaxID=300181 RepID=UPI0011CC7572|nr:transposase [Serratia ureilytica]TXE50886.1 transposase [Serratia ureilytica]